MTHLFKTFVAGVAALGLAGVAHANTFDVEFTYDTAAPVETIYAEFSTTARKACWVDPLRVGGIGQKARIERACRSQLIDKAVEAARSDALSAYHMQQSDQRPQRRLFAGLW